MMYTFSKSSLENREGIDSRLIEIDDLALTISPIDFGHGRYSGLRTAEIQNELFFKGQSKCDGYTDLSFHQSGKALDFYAYVNGKASWDTEHLAIVAAAHLQAASLLGCKLKWGGFFTPNKVHNDNDYAGGWDYPHIELVD